MQLITLTRQGCKFLFILINMLLISSRTSAQYKLSDEALPFKPSGYYIAALLDERVDNKPLAKVITFNSIKQYIAENVIRKTTLTPVVITIRELALTEKRLEDSSLNGRINLQLSFGLEKNYGIEHLTDYRGALNFKRRGDQMAGLERDLRSILKASFVYFNEWMKANEASNRKLAKNVKISFSDFSETPEGDTIYYNDKRLLTWSDFKSRNRPGGSFQAVVMPGLGYTQEARLVDGTIQVKIAVKAFLPKSAAWAYPAGRDDYALNHEQRHFDIVKIISEQFKQKILAKPLTPDSWEAIVNMQYLDSHRDMTAMQKAYDKETAHGMNRIAQEAWNQRIDKDLKLIH